jgi:LmbE family N-acetylglucosaminyl deacetylase
MLLENIGGVVEEPVPVSNPQLVPMRFPVAPAANAAVIVAHPDDETLWAGGTILTHPNDNWFIATLCRKSDPDRSQKFFHALHDYGAAGAMADLDDGPEQTPLPTQSVQRTLLGLLPPIDYDLVLTHAPGGEYTRHRRHEEVSQAVMALWGAGVISARELRLFAYEDDQGRRLPKAIQSAHHFEPLSETTRQEKYRLITEVYGFGPASWEARALPQSEAFWCFRSPTALQTWLGEIWEDR